MYSFIFPRASSKGRRALILSGLIVAGPLLWLTLLQTNYVLAYPTCEDRSNGWIYISSAIAVALVAGALLATRAMWRKEPFELRSSEASVSEQREAEGDHVPVSAAARFFLVILSLLMCALFLVVVLGTALPPLVLRPCD